MRTLRLDVDENRARDAWRLLTIVLRNEIRKCKIVDKSRYDNASKDLRQINFERASNIELIALIKSKLIARDSQLSSFHSWFDIEEFWWHDVDAKYKTNDDEIISSIKKDDRVFCHDEICDQWWVKKCKKHALKFWTFLKNRFASLKSAYKVSICKSLHLN